MPGLDWSISFVQYLMKRDAFDPFIRAFDKHENLFCENSLTRQKVSTHAMPRVVLYEAIRIKHRYNEFILNERYGTSTNDNRYDMVQGTFANWTNLLKNGRPHGPLEYHFDILKCHTEVLLKLFSLQGHIIRSLKGDGDIEAAAKASAVEDLNLNKKHTEELYEIIRSAKRWLWSVEEVAEEIGVMTDQSIWDFCAREYPRIQPTEAFDANYFGALSRIVTRNGAAFECFLLENTNNIVLQGNEALIYDLCTLAKILPMPMRSGCRVDWKKVPAAGVPAVGVPAAGVPAAGVPSAGDAVNVPTVLPALPYLRTDHDDNGDPYSVFVFEIKVHP